MRSIVLLAQRLDHRLTFSISTEDFRGLYFDNTCKDAIVEEDQRVINNGKFGWYCRESMLRRLVDE